MAKKKVMNAIEKFEIIKKKLCEHRDIKYDKNSIKDLEDRAILALLELKECEEEYMKSEDEDFWFSRSFEDINLKEIGNQCFWDININNDKILPNTSILVGDESYIEKPENDNSSIDITPVFDRMNDNDFTNNMVGIKFSLESQMGYILNYTNTDLNELKELQRKLNLYIDKIERRLSHITVIGCGVEYEYDSTNSGYDLSQADIDYRTEILKNDHGLHKNFKVVKVERNNIGDETWYVEGFEEENSELYKIKIEGYPCDFTFISKKPFKEDYNKTKYDEERQSFLLSKMKKLKLPNSGHAYEDFVIERVKKVKGGEVWILGS
jgi:hypothetical protein